MSDIPLKALAALSALTTYVFVGHLPNALPFSKPSYLGTFVGVFSLQFSLWALWRVILYPKFFSPLRHLPTPSGGSWWNGQFARIQAEPTGAPMMDW